MWPCAEDMAPGGPLKLLVAQVNGLHNDPGRLRVEDVGGAEGRSPFPPRDARVRQILLVGLDRGQLLDAVVAHEGIGQLRRRVRVPVHHEARQVQQGLAPVRRRGEPRVRRVGSDFDRRGGFLEVAGHVRLLDAAEVGRELDCIGEEREEDVGLHPVTRALLGKPDPLVHLGLDEEGHAVQVGLGLVGAAILDCHRSEIVGFTTLGSGLERGQDDVGGRALHGGRGQQVAVDADKIPS